MPWSPEYAATLIEWAIDDGSPLTQSKVQRLIYIAHGYHLAATGAPLTGDRPEAWEYGPVFSRVADLLSPFGSREIAAHLSQKSVISSIGAPSLSEAILTPFEQTEMEALHLAYASFALFPDGKLDILTRGEGAPWDTVYNGGKGLRAEIPHVMIQEQFATLEGAQNTAPSR